MRLELDKIQPRYLFLDPASGKAKAGAIKGVRARSAIVVVGMDALQRIFVLDAWAERAGTNVIVKNFVEMSVRWGPVVCGYEDVGQQSLLIDPIMNYAESLGVTLPLAPVTVNTKVEKKWRIRALLQPPIGAGRLLIRDDLIELKNELTSFPMNARMDLVDALASAVSLTPPVASVANDFDEKRELARYLRESGALPSEIEERLKDYSDEVKDEKDGWWHKLTKLGKLRARS